MKKLLYSIGVSLVLAGHTHAETAAQVSGYYWLMTPEGEAAVGLDGVAGTRADLEDDLGYDSEEDVYGARVVFGDTHQIGVDYFAIDMSAENVIDRDIRFSDLDFSISERVASQFEATLIRGYYQINGGGETARGGIILGGQYARFEASASSDATGSASEDVDAGTPFLGVHMALQPIPELRLAGSFLGSQWDYGDVDATFYDLELTGSLILGEHLVLGGGYRYINIDAEYEDADFIEVEVTFSGPILFAGFEW
jgi:hypothetical protein